MWLHVGVYQHAFDNIVVALPELGKDNAIHAFVYA